ncbi:MAG: UDP-glucose/GDP-mannose dehydrogenase family protein [Proteobacteria bacterium]|nr:UDP-glucose/GDP-mannose dehydrogenase family protein [Pseudomonadota bacterium]
MLISVYGAGYVGLVSAACLAKIGHEVICADINEHKIASLMRGECPIYEKDLPELLAEQFKQKKLIYTSDLNLAIKKANIHIIATGTPSTADGEADLSQVYAVARTIALNAEKDLIIVTKSTVPVGTNDNLQAFINELLVEHKKGIKIEVASNPEFLREGTAVYDFLNADRIIIGGCEKSLELLEEMYLPLREKGIPLLRMNLRSAELTKYSANAMLACRISFMNQISQMAESFDANIEDIKQGLALDPRIGSLFLNAGIGYGGSCFPKDVRALIHTAKKTSLNASMLQAIEAINEEQKHWVFKKVNKHFNGKLQGLVLAVWGLSFKPGTDDLREASSLVAIDELLKAGVKIRVFDPIAMPHCQKNYEANAHIQFCSSAKDVFSEEIDGLIIMTEWAEFAKYSLSDLKESLNEAPLFDGRNCFAIKDVKLNQLSYYYSVGRPVVVS